MLHMLLIQRKKHGIPFAESWFAPTRKMLRQSAPRFGLVRVLQAGWKFPFATHFLTLLVDVTQGDETLLNACSKSKRQDIRKAERELNPRTATLHNPDDETLKQCEAFHNRCAEGKPIAPFNFTRMQRYRDVGALFITEVFVEEMGKLAQHVYVHSAERARLLYSTTIPAKDDARTAIGRANTFLQFYDFGACRELGLKWCDLGGVQSFDASGDRGGIDKFKLGFGGKEVVEYSGITLNI